MSLPKTVPAPPETTETPAQEERFTIPAHVDRWDEYFLNIAKAVSIKSKDPKCPVGAVIASGDNVLLTTGFNGLARGVHDDEQTLTRHIGLTRSHPGRNTVMPENRRVRVVYRDLIVTAKSEPKTEMR